MTARTVRVVKLADRASGTAPITPDAQPALAVTPLTAQHPTQDAAVDTTRYLAVLDFEATCWHMGRERQDRESEIIEFPTVLYKYQASPTGGGADLQRVGEWQSFVRPTLNPVLSPYCLNLTGISQASVDTAPDLAHVLTANAEWLSSATSGAPSSHVRFVTCGDWDLGQLLPLELRNKGLAAPAVYSTWINLKQEFARAYVVRGRAPDMLDMLRLAGLALEGRHHSGLDDARNIGRCLEACWRRGHRDFNIRTAANRGY